MHYIVLDLETSIKNRGEESIGKHKASPFHPENKIVYFAVEYENDETFVLHIDGNMPKGEYPHTIGDEPYMIVGQNIKFDLLYMMKHASNFKEFMRNGKIWDIQLAEYLLSGQTLRHQSLDKMAERYGLPLKDEKIKEYWDDGIDTEDIPAEEIVPYVEHDVSVTHKIFKEQLKKAGELGMLPLMATQMDALMATCEMEYNGMRFDRVGATRSMLALQTDKNDLEQALVHGIEEELSKECNDWVESSEFNPMSNQQISAILFGGIVKYKGEEVVLDDDGNATHYKTGKKAGKPKTKKVMKTSTISGLIPDQSYVTTINKTGYYKVDEGVLKKLSRILTPAAEEAKDYIDNLLKIKFLDKLIGTYYKPYTSLVWHDGCIHPTYNHASTVTGRLSSSSPNLQNVNSKSED